MSVSCECCVLSGRGLCFGSVTGMEKSPTESGVISKPQQRGGLGPLRSSRHEETSEPVENMIEN